jgi:hypothetical protein
MVQAPLCYPMRGMKKEVMAPAVAVVIADPLDWGRAAMCIHGEFCGDRSTGGALLYHFPLKYLETSVVLVLCKAVSCRRT